MHIKDPECARTARRIEEANERKRPEILAKDSCYRALCVCPLMTRVLVSIPEMRTAGDRGRLLTPDRHMHAVYFECGPEFM